MKKIIAVTILFVSIIKCFAQTDVTTFLGIPVDGTKTEMIRKLKSKGFRSKSLNNDVLNGEFNGRDVNLYIGTNGNKVYRIMLCDANLVNEHSILIRFNNLCQQFENNPRYVSLFNDNKIPDDENISYGIITNKRYEAVFYQKPAELDDTTALKKKFLPILMEKFAIEDINNPSPEIKKEMLNLAIPYLMELFTKKAVWFTINEDYGQYYITMYYDNVYNQANGEDL